MSVLTALGVASLAVCVWLTWSAARTVAPAGGQTRLDSLKEAWTNIAIGFAINFTANILLLPLVGAKLTAASNFWLGCIYTAISPVRQYVLRRRFNARMLRQQEKR